MVNFVTVAYLCLLIGQAVCDLECYKCWDCKEKEENWDKCTEDSIPPDSSESTTTTITSTITPPPPPPTTTTITTPPTITITPTPSITTITPPTTTTIPSHSSETSVESSTNSETTTPNISESTTNKTSSELNDKPDNRIRTTTSLPIIKVILGKSAEVETKQHKCAFIKYKDDNDKDIIDRFCTMKENCENIGKTAYADKKIICNVCETNLCNKDEPGGGRSIHSGTFATVFVVAISKTLLFN